jgi:hypothetical protein
MKRIALAAFASLALTTVGCASANDSSASEGANLSEGKPNTTVTRTISLDFKNDVANLTCASNGNGAEDFSVQFDFQGRHYNASRHIDFWGCQVERDTLLKTIQSGSITDEESDTVDLSTIALDGGQSVFISGAADSTTTTTKISFDLATVSPVCRVEMGWWISFSFEGQQYQTYGADDVGTCNAHLSTIEHEGAHPSTLVEERHQTFVKRTITTDSGLIFTSYQQL